MTPILLLFVVVFVQVAAFLFASIRLSRVIPGSVVETKSMPAAVAARIKAFEHRAGRYHTTLGVLFCLAAISVTFVLPIGYGPKKILLTVISLASSLTLAVGLIVDHRMLARITAAMPEPTLRTAMLEKRTLRDYRSPVWEVVPIAVLLATVGLSIWAVLRNPLPGADPVAVLTNIRFWVTPLIQAAFILFMSLATLSRAAGGGLSSSVRSLHQHPEQGIALDQHLRRLEVRHGVYFKIGITLLLGLVHCPAHSFLGSGGARTGLVVSQWVVVLILLAVFVSYLLKLKLTRKREAMGRG